MKSLLHRINQLSEGERRRIKRSRRGQTEPGVATGYDARDASEKFMRGMVGLALEDPGTVYGRRALWARYEGSRWRPKIPPCVEELRRIFETVYHQFRARLESYGEDDRWASYSISFMAMRRCARLEKLLEMAYVYRACQNAHKKFLTKNASCGLRVEADGIPAPTTHPEVESSDLAMDLEYALGRLHPTDARIVRMRFGDATYEEIGEELGIDQSTAFRRYKEALGRLRVALKDYASEDDQPVTVAAWAARRGLAA
jgi:RNA polymerase sigma factor (sigma-70 family)